MESFNAIPIFVAVAEQNGFSPAARELGISKSAVSKRISLLEDQLGVRLFHRTTRRLSLTEAGERFYEHAAQATRAAQCAEDAVGELQGEPRGLLKILVPMSFGLLHVAPLIPSFLQRYPNTRIDLVMDDSPIHLIKDGFDLAICAGDLPDSSLISRKLANIHSQVCCSPDFYKRNKHNLESPLSLRDMNCILYSHSANADFWEFYTGETQSPAFQINVSGNYQVNNSEALKEAVIKGAGIGRLPSFVAGKHLKNGELIQLFPEYRMPTKPIQAVYPERHYMPAKVKAFLDFAIQYFGDDKPYWDISPPAG